MTNAMRKHAWRAAVSAAAIAMVAMPSFAADWTDANSVTYTALKSINGGGSGRTAGGFIITDITPAGTETVKFKVKTPANVSVDTANGCVYCARSFTKNGSKWTPVNQFTGFRLYANNSPNFRIDRMGTQTSLTGVTCAPTTEYSAFADYTTGDVTVNSAVQSQNLGTGSYTPGGKLSILASYSNLLAPATPTASSTWVNYLPDDLYYLQLWSAAGALEHNFMPASRDSDSKVGLYDTVTRTFYAAAKNTITGAAKSAVTGSPVKWTGAGDGVMMSSGANWEGGNAPQEGDDLDFTIAVPNAEINADIGATFGKLWLGDGDGPVFTGTLSVTSVNDGTKIHGAVTIVAYYNWNGNGANWSDAGAWTFDNAPTAWSDGVNALFDIANASATLTADASANTVSFSQPAAIDGSSTLTVSTVSVAPNVSVVISAPTAGALEKTGEGTLTLGSSRTELTTVSEGTLAMANGATVVPANLTLGSDSSTPVTFDYAGQTFDAQLAAFITPGANVTLTNIVHSNSGSMVIKKDNAPSVLTVAKDATLEFADHATFNTDTETTLNIVGGTVKTKKNTNNWLMQTSLTGRLNINVTDGGLLEFGGETYLLTCRDAVDGSTDYQDPSLYFRVVDSTLRVLNNRSFYFGDDGSNKNPVCPTGVFAATNSVIDVPYNISFGNNIVGANTAGSYTADFENCIITARAVRVYHDRPLNAIRFNDTRFALAADRDNWLYSSPEFETEFGTPIKPITINAGGLVLDTNGHNGGLNSDPHGAGAITKVGDGILYIRRNQTSSSPLVCEGGETYVYDGLSVARAVTVKSGAKFTTKGAGQVALANISFEAGAELSVDGYDGGVVPIAVMSLTLPASGTVTLTKNNNFSQGKYRILEKTGIAVADVQDKLVPATDNLAYSWSVEGNTLVLTVGNPTANAWTGFAGDGKMSTPGNWLGNAAPGAGDPVDFSAVNVATTVNADIDATLGSVTMGEGVITFTNAIAATNFTDTSKISVGADSTVTVVGDLEISGETSRSIVYTIAADGRFVVTGDIIATEDFSGSDLYPSVTMACPGTFVARGLVNRGTVGRSFRLYNNGNGSHVTWVIGDHGISSSGSPGATGAAGFWCFNRGNSSATIIADADFTIAAWLTNRGKLVLNTTGQDGAPHTITIGDGTTGLLDNDGVVETTGEGKVLFNCVSTFSGGLAVKGSSTVAVNPGCRAGNNTIHLYEDTSLEVAQSGTVTLAGNLKLDNNTALAFNFTESANPPVLALATGKSVIFTSGASTNIAVKVSGAHPRGGEKILTTCGGFNAEGVTVSLADGAPKWAKSVDVNEDGNIVLDVKPMGTKVIVR